MKKSWIVAAVLFASASFGWSQTIVLSEDFEVGSLPTGWSRSQSTPSAGWEFGSDLGSQFFVIPAHTQYAASNDDAHDDNSGSANVADLDYLITPVMDLTPFTGSAVDLAFTYFQPGTYGSVGTVEVTTNGGTTWATVATVPNVSDVWSTISVDLSAYTSSSSVQVGFHHNDNGQWADGFAIDDVVVSVPPPLDASLDSLNNPQYVLAGPVYLEGSITNRGSDLITSITVQYQLNGGQVQSWTFNGISLPHAATFDLIHLVAADLSVPGSYVVDMWIEDVNGVADGDSSNDAVSGTISALSSIPEKRAVLEMYTGSWCQFCTDGFVRLEEVLSTHHQVIGVVVHSGDAMEIPDGITLANAYIGGYPSGTIDRFRFASEPAVELNRGIWMDRATERLDDIVPLSVAVTEATFDPGTREIGVTVQASFVGAISGDLRFNCLVLEDPVTGSGSGYDQVNFYDTQAGHPYFGAGNPIIGFEHAYTLREMLGTAWGTAGTIPATVVAGEVFTHTYTYQLPAGFDEDNVSLVGLVSMYDNDINQREILNADQVRLLILWEDGFETGDTSMWSSTQN